MTGLREHTMGDWGGWTNTSHGSDLLAYYNNCSQRSPSLLNSLRINGSVSGSAFTHSPGAAFIHSPSKQESDFCAPDNVDQCASILNQEIMMLGLSSIFREESETADLCCLINSCHDLVLLHQRAMREREELETRYHRTLSDLDQSQNLKSRLKSDLEFSKRQQAQCQEKERQIATKNRTLNVKLKSEKEETRRLHSVMSSRDLQYKHDLKKREREMNKLKERLHQVLMDKKHERQIGMNIVNAIQRTDGRRSTWKTGSHKQEEEMYRSVISNYEHKQQTLMIENAKLRDTLQSMQAEIASLLSKQDCPLKFPVQSDSPEASLSCSDDDVSVLASECSVVSTDKISEGVYQMPYDMVRKDIEKNFHETCQMLKEVVRHSKKKKDLGGSKKVLKDCGDDLNLASTPMATGKHAHENVDDLVDKLNKFKWIVKEQEELIQQSLHNQSKSVENSLLHDSQILHDKEGLAEERRRLNADKASFEADRKQLTEAAIRIGRQKKEIEDEKNRLFQQEFLQLSPFVADPERSLLMKSSKSSKEGSRLLPSTPNYSTSPSIMVSGSASPDIYRVMGLEALSPSKKSGVKTKPPISPHITKAPILEPGAILSTGDGPLGSSPPKRKGSCGTIRMSPGTSVDSLSQSLDGLKKTLFNGKPKRSNSRTSLN